MPEERSTRLFNDLPDGCPYCGKHDYLSDDSPEFVDAETLCEDYYCSKCDKHWSVVFKFSHWLEVVE